MANDSNGHKGANIWPWALITGLAVGFLVGREIGGRGGESTPREPARVAQVAAGADAKYKSEAQFPANWLKAADLTSVTSFDGLSDAQKALVMQALNERNCECGCGKGSVAFCAKNDTACPKSPQLVKQAVALAKEGKSLADVLAYLDRENPPKGGGAAAAPTPPPPGPKKVAIPAHSPRKGPKHAKVTIVEFSDFQCPFCSRVNPTLAQITKTYPNDVAIVFVNQPLAFHDRAEPAGRAFLAAARQGKGWEMHDKLFANQQALSDADLEKYATELKLNVGKWKTDYQSSELKEQVKADQTLANSVGANGTPTFFINGRELVGAQPFEQFKTVIDEEIKKADELLKSGVKADQLYEKLMEQAAAAPAPAGNNDNAPSQAKVAIEVGSSPVKGPKNAPVTVVAFSDFECPFCSRVVPTLKQIEDTYKGKVRVAFKNLPLDFHANAQVAAEAALAANEQGKFWEMHDKMFENQRQLDRLSLEKYAQDLGLNLPKFKQALDSGKYKDQVQKDKQLASTVGATGTPTFFVNGRSLVGAQPFDAFKKLIDEELAAKK
jgi:protein-disulfide isomerase